MSSTVGNTLKLMHFAQLDKLVLAGYSTLLLLTIVLFGWSTLVPLADSIIAQGTVSVAAQRRTIAHFEGGTVRSLRVSEGDYVEAGQILLELDGKDLQTKLDVLEHEHFAQRAKLEHLMAERAEEAAISPESELFEEAESSPQHFELLRSEIDGLQARLQAFESQSALLEERIRQGTEQLGRLRQQLQSLERQHLIVQRQSQDAEALLRKGYGTKSRANELSLDKERVLGRRLELEAEIDGLEGAVRDAQLGKEKLTAERAHEIEERIWQTRRTLAEVGGQLRDTRDRIESLIIKSNVGGVIVDLMIQSANDVIKPAAPILDILPTDSAYLIEVRVPPDKIEGLAEGMSVEVRLRGLSDEQSRSLPGRVALVSADIANDPKAQHEYFRIHVSLTDWQSVSQDLAIMPGMPADVVFRKRDRTAVEYFLAPFMDHLFRSAT